VLAGKAPFWWGEAEQAAFEAIKKEMSEVTRLVLVPNLNKPFDILVDASMLGLGGILQQDLEGVPTPVAFWRRKLDPPEQNWHIRELEMLAAVQMLHKFKHWLLSVEVRIHTDHKSLIYMQTTSELSGGFLRWLDTLRQFNIRWIYVKGEDNHADWLSRDPAYETASMKERSCAFRDYFAKAHAKAVKGDVVQRRRFRFRLR